MTAVNAGTVRATTMRVSPTVPGAPQPTLDEESRRWLRDLRAEGPVREAAIARLHGLLLRAARFETARRRGTLAQLSRGEVEELALEAADDALMSILARLDDFRGASRFTTWAYKFALFEASVKLRKRAWREREVPVEPETWDAFASGILGPAASAEQADLFASLGAAVAALTEHQRRVLVLLALDGVPIDVLAERLGTTRGALYKTLHDARRRLRAELAAVGLRPDSWLEERG
jgi:RNA polymerase sigma-70 factor (ECF subfamily)